MMNISQEDFQFMVEDITSDLACMLVEKKHLSIQEAIDAVYNSQTYSALTNPETGLYSQSSGYIYEYLLNELSDSPR